MSISKKSPFSDDCAMSLATLALHTCTCVAGWVVSAVQIGTITRYVCVFQAWTVSCIRMPTSARALIYAWACLHRSSPSVTTSTGTSRSGRPEEVHHNARTDITAYTFSLYVMLRCCIRGRVGFMLCVDCQATADACQIQ